MTTAESLIADTARMLCEGQSEAAVLHFRFPFCMVTNGDYDVFSAPPDIISDLNKSVSEFKAIGVTRIASVPMGRHIVKRSTESIDARWDFIDAAGNLVFSNPARFYLRRDEEGRLLIEMMENLNQGPCTLDTHVLSAQVLQ